MALYNESQRVRFLEVGEVVQAFIDYNRFFSARENFYKSSGDLAEDLLEKIHDIKKIPSELWNNLPEHFKIGAHELKTLEKECEIVLSNKK